MLDDIRDECGAVDVKVEIVMICDKQHHISLNLNRVG